MTAEHGGERPAAAPPDWQDWRQWVEGVDWSDWRSWLRRIAATDWAAAPWPGTPWEQAARCRACFPDPARLRGRRAWRPDRRASAGNLAGVPAVVAWRPERQAVRGRGRGAARGAHARTRADLAAADRHARGRSRRRGRAGAVESAAVPDRLLPGGGPARRPGPGQELRLGLPAVRRGRSPDGLRRPPGARHARLPVGAAGRGQRRRAGRLADLRRPAAGRRGLRDPAGDPLRAADLRERRGSRAGAAPDPGAHVVQRHRAGPRRQPVHGVPGSGPRWPRVTEPGRGHQLPGQGGVGAVRRGHPDGRAAGAAGGNAARPARTPAASSPPACGRRCTPPASARASGPCTPPSTGPARASPATTGPARPGNTRWTGSEPAASKSGSALPSQPQAGRPGSRRRPRAPGSAGCGAVAGPRATEPSAIRKTLPCHGQVRQPSASSPSDSGPDMWLHRSASTWTCAAGPDRHHRDLAEQHGGPACPRAGRTRA